MSCGIDRVREPGRGHKSEPTGLSHVDRETGCVLGLVIGLAGWPKVLRAGRAEWPPHAMVEFTLCRGPVATGSETGRVSGDHVAPYRRGRLIRLGGQLPHL